VKGKDEVNPETGLPVHLPMGMTVDGQGPEDNEAAVWVQCWCEAGPVCEVFPRRPGPTQVLPVYFATVRQLEFDPHDVGRLILLGG